MKTWFHYFFLHMATAWALGGYLLFVLILAQSALTFVPFYKIQLLVAVQALAFIPFYLSVPSLLARKTGDYLPENKSYYSAFGVAHFPSFILTICFVVSYIRLKSSGIQEHIIENMEVFSKSLGESTGLLGTFLEQLCQVPVSWIAMMDEVLLCLVLYVLAYVAMAAVLERRRLTLVFQDV